MARRAICLCIRAVDVLAVSRAAPLACLAGVPARYVIAAAKAHIPVIKMLDVVERSGLAVEGVVVGRRDVVVGVRLRVVG